MPFFVILPRSTVAGAEDALICYGLSFYKGSLSVLYRNLPLKGFDSFDYFADLESKAIRFCQAADSGIAGLGP